MKQVPYRLAEALENICKRKALESITVSEIAAEAGVTRQVFYHHFVDKFELAAWIHYVHLYQAIKSAMTEKKQNMWRQITLGWLERLLKNRSFYTNAFQSNSRKEFQRIIRELFFTAYQWQIECCHKRSMTEAELFVLHMYCIGGMEKVYEWISRGMNTPVERLAELLELSMPEIIRELIVTEKEIPYGEWVNMMEKYISEEGLLQAIS